MPAPKDPIKYQMWLDNLSKSHKWNPKCHPPGWSEKVSLKLTGRERTQEHCENISKAKLGQKYPVRSKEYCNKISIALSNKPKSEEHKKKLSISRKNLSIESRLNISNAAKKRFQNIEYMLKHRDANIKRVEKLIGGFWYGNIRYYNNQYCEKWTADLRERVRAYFGYICFECGVKQKGRKLSVHHIHYNKKTCCDGSPHDMVPLCAECHTKTNFNRDYWEDHFTEMLYLISPEGKCFFTKEEMGEFTQPPKGFQSELISPLKYESNTPE